MAGRGVVGWVAAWRVAEWGPVWGPHLAGMLFGPSFTSDIMMSSTGLT